MTKYKKKPVVIEAEQFIVLDPFQKEFLHWPILHDKEGCYLEIVTLEGIMRVSEGDWIIKGVKGEFYPCKPDIFALTYEVLI